jgi:PKD repeat protein
LYCTTFAVLFAWVAAAAHAGTTSLAWDASVDARVVGYTIHYGTASGSYPNSVNAGNGTSYTLTNLADGQRYFFVVSAYDAGGAHSGYSNEVSVAHLMRGSAPTADFSATPTSGPAPLTVAFTSTSSGSITTYQWDFGDGAGWVESGTDVTARASHTYATPGLYTVQLTAIGPEGRSVETRVAFVSVSAAASDATEMTLFEDAEPRNPSADDARPATVGMRFVARTAGAIVGIRFFKGPENTGVHSGQLWTTAGELLASASFTHESASGWQVVRFPSPVRIEAGTALVASYHAPRGRYAVDTGYFAKGVANSALHAPASTSREPNGRLSYGATPAFPSAAGKQANYWVDVLFVPAE